MSFAERRVAIVVSHPIQHFCPQYSSIAGIEGIKLKVFFASRLGLEKYIDPQFKREISWGNLGLDTFPHEFLSNEVIQADKNIDASSLDSALSAYNPELLIVYGFYQKLQRRALRWALKSGVQVAYVSDSEKRQKRGWLKELVKYAFLSRYFKNIDYFLTVGDANEDYYRSYGVSDSKMVRMHFPIDIASYRNSYTCREKLRSETRSRYGISEGDLVMAVVGKLVSWKNQDHIIYAMRNLEEEGVVSTLFIIGSGKEMPVWQEKAKTLRSSKVLFTDFVKIEDLPRYYAASDIYVHPASVEPHSIAISEAIYMGCPVILSDRCGSYGINDDVHHGVNGFSYPFGDISQLSGRIRELYLDSEKRATMGLASHERSVRFQKLAHGDFLKEIMRRL
jgi:glycosyltransferase involved in cell wall biosynthesis